MDFIDFEFKKERKLGEFVQDFINLLRIIIGHIGKVMFQLLALPICGMLLVGYYLSTQLNAQVDYSSGEVVNLVVAAVAAFGFLLLVGLFAFGFTIEYFLLLRDQRNLQFGSRDVWMSFRIHMLLYFRFLAAAIIVTILAAVPIALLAFVSMLIPIVGSFALGILLSMVGLWYFSAFMLYREGYYDLMDTFGSAFTFLKKKIFEYGSAAYLVSFLFQILLYMISAMPALVIFLIAYNSVGFGENFFDTYWGKVISSFGGSMLTVFVIVYNVLSVLSYGIIYETAKEVNFGENIFERIAKIGGKVD